MKTLQDYQKLLKEVNIKINTHREVVGITISSNTGNIVGCKLTEYVMDSLKTMEALGYNQAFYERKIKELSQ